MRPRRDVCGEYEAQAAPGRPLRSWHVYKCVQSRRGGIGPSCWSENMIALMDVVVRFRVRVRVRVRVVTLVGEHDGAHGRGGESAEGSEDRMHT